MPLFTLGHVYQLGDFDTSGSNITPPDEQGAQASGSPPFDITLSAGASGQQIIVDDTADTGLDEINFAGQTIDQPITLDGTTYPAA